MVESPLFWNAIEAFKSGIGFDSTLGLSWKHSTDGFTNHFSWVMEVELTSLSVVWDSLVEEFVVLSFVSEK